METNELTGPTSSVHPGASGGPARDVHFFCALLASDNPIGHADVIYVFRGEVPVMRSLERLSWLWGEWSGWL